MSSALHAHKLVYHKLPKTVVHVVRIVTDANMRLTRYLWDNEPRVLRGLKRGEVVLLLNRAHTMVRLVDVQGVQHTIYCYASERFDLKLIQQMVQQRTLCLGLEIINDGGSAKPDRDISLPPRKVRVGKR